MKDVKVASVQMSSKAGDVQGNLAKIARFTARAHKRGVEFVLFPELSVSGYWMNPELGTVAEKVPGPSVTALEKLAKKHKLVVSAGIAERSRQGFYITQVVVAPDGYVGKHRKSHLGVTEAVVAKPGNRFEVFKLDKFVLGVLICYENNFVEGYRIMLLKGAEVIAEPASGAVMNFHHSNTKNPRPVAERDKLFRDGLRARDIYYARFNGVAKVYCNAVGDNGRGEMFPGCSWIIDPEGRVLVEQPMVECYEDLKERLIAATLDAAVLDRVRAQPTHYLNSRRPELYGPIARK